MLYGKSYRYHAPVGSLVCEIAMHSCDRRRARCANWLISHRSASWSYRTTGSPSLWVWQRPPNPLQSVLVGDGPNSFVPVLLKIVNVWLTIWT